MKKIIFGLFALLTLASCGHDSIESLNAEQVKATKNAKFENDFNGTFKVTAADYANHQWGMNTVPLVEINTTTTRSAYPNGNLWADEGYTIPADITADELEAVLDVFNKKGEASYTSLVDWDCFFVQQVYKGEANYYAHNQYIDNDVSKGLKEGATQLTGSDHMDWLCTETNKKMEVICWWPYEEELKIVAPYPDHIFDFNDSNSDDYGGRMLMLNSNTNKFGYHNSEDSQVHYYFRMEEINGNYYVGLDFSGEGQNPNQQITRDYIYNDWIVKIVPSNGYSQVDRVRIMCEDLGTETSDFDYNDVVFDIKFIKNGNKYTADIVLQAAGGTLPLTIGGQEVHNLFAVANQDKIITTATMINTHANVGEHVDGLAPVQFTVELNGSNYSTAWDAINDLPVIVLYNGIPLQLTVNPGTPAEMIAVPYDTAWSNERVSIRNAYPSFVDWIRDSSITWWE